MEAELAACGRAIAPCSFTLAQDCEIGFAHIASAIYNLLDRASDGRCVVHALTRSLVQARSGLATEYDFSQQQADGFILTLSDTLDQVFERSDKRIADIEARSDKRFEESKAESDQRFEKLIADSKRQFEESKAESDREFERIIAESNRRFEEIKAESDRRYEESKADFNRRFDEREARIDKRFDGVDSRLDKVEGRLNDVEKRLDTIGWRTAASSAAGGAGMIGIVAATLTILKYFTG